MRDLDLERVHSTSALPQVVVMVGAVAPYVECRASSVVGGDLRRRGGR